MNLNLLAEELNISALEDGRISVNIHNVPYWEQQNVVRKIASTRGVEFVLDLFDWETLEAYWNKTRQERIEANKQESERGQVHGC